MVDEDPAGTAEPAWVPVMTDGSAVARAPEPERGPDAAAPSPMNPALLALIVAGMFAAISMRSGAVPSIDVIERGPAIDLVIFVAAILGLVVRSRIVDSVVNPAAGESPNAGVIAAASSVATWIGMTLGAAFLAAGFYLAFNVGDGWVFVPYAVVGFLFAWRARPRKL